MTNGCHHCFAYVWHWSVYWVFLKLISSWKKSCEWGRSGGLFYCWLRTNLVIWIDGWKCLSFIKNHIKHRHNLCCANHFLAFVYGYCMCWYLFLHKMHSVSAPKLFFSNKMFGALKRYILAWQLVNFRKEFSKHARFGKWVGNDLCRVKDFVSHPLPRTARVRIRLSEVSSFHTSCSKLKENHQLREMRQSTACNPLMSSKDFKIFWPVCEGFVTDVWHRRIQYSNNFKLIYVCAYV